MDNWINMSGGVSPENENISTTNSGVANSAANSGIAPSGNSAANSAANSGSPDSGNNRQMLTKRIQICDFICDEVALYLDTHPKDKVALDYFAKYLAMKKEACAEYAKKYGPMTHDAYIAGENWKWVENPWPWERNEG